MFCRFPKLTELVGVWSQVSDSKIHAFPLQRAALACSHLVQMASACYWNDYCPFLLDSHCSSNQITFTFTFLISQIHFQKPKLPNLSRQIASTYGRLVGKSVSSCSAGGTVSMTSQWHYTHLVTRGGCVAPGEVLLLKGSLWLLSWCHIQLISFSVSFPPVWDRLPVSPSSH